MILKDSCGLGMGNLSVEGGMVILPLELD